MNNPFSYHNRKKVGLAREDHLVCPICYSKEDVEIGEASTVYPWLITLRCTNDPNHPTWHSCTICKSGVRKRMMNERSIKLHHKKCHRIVNNRSTDATDATDAPSITNFGESFETLNESNPFNEATAEDDATSSIVGFPHMNQHSKDFFRQQHVSDSGWRSLISRSFFQGYAPPSEIDKKELDLALSILHVSNVLSRNDRDVFATLLALLEETTQKRLVRHLESRPLRWNLPIPTSGAALRSVCFKGKNCFFANLPIPDVQKIDGFSYVSLLSIVSDFLACGHPYDKTIYDDITTDCEVNTITSLGTSPVGQSIRKRALRRAKDANSSLPLVILYVIEWSDAFEPNIIKTNKGSVWIKTVTISPIQGGSPTGADKRHRNTYPLSIGPKSGDRQKLEEAFKQDLDRFRQGDLIKMYDGHTKSMCYVHLELLASVQDQPERRAENCVSLGNATFTSCWGDLVDYKKLVSKIIPCESCRNKLLNSSPHERNQIDSCAVCVSWNLNAANSKTLLRAKPSPDYPEDKLDDDGLIPPRKMTFESLRAAALEAHTNLLSGRWTQKATNAYLQGSGLSERAKEGILEHAVFCKNSLIIQEQGTEEELEALSRMRERDPNICFPWKNPPSWNRGMHHWQHVEAIMHLVFHGIQKSMAHKIEEWASRRGSLSSFKKYSANILQPIQDLKLEWCKIQPYTGGKLGGWVGETHLAMARINPWFYSALRFLKRDEMYVGDPTTRPQFWTKKENQLWLQARGLPYDSKQKAAELKKLVEEYLSKPEIPPLLPQISITEDDIINLAQSATEMCSLIMHNQVSDQYLKKLEWSIRVFLTRFDMVDSGVRINSKEKPTWITSYNFLSLLNLPNMARQFGPLRNLWEGGYLGEGYLRMMKPLFRNTGAKGFRANWETNLHQSALRDKVLDNRPNNTERSCSQDEDNQRKQFEKYESIFLLKKAIQFKNVLSCISLRDNTLAFVLKDLSLVKIKVTPVTRVNNIQYSKIDIEEDSTVEPQRYEEENTKKFAILLPRLTKYGLPKLEEREETTYAIVCSDWTYH